METSSFNSDQQWEQINEMEANITLGEHGHLTLDWIAEEVLKKCLRKQTQPNTNTKLGDHRRRAQPSHFTDEATETHDLFKVIPVAIIRGIIWIQLLWLQSLCSFYWINPILQISKRHLLCVRHHAKCWNIKTEEVLASSPENWPIQWQIL